MSLTKEECEKALENLKEPTDNWYSSELQLAENNDEPIEYKNQESLDLIEKLIKKHFNLKEKYSKILDDVHDYRYETHAMKMTIRNLCKYFGVKNEEELKNIYLNPPLKFEELKVGMWVWDRRDNKYVHIYMTRIYEYDTGCFFKGQKLLRIYCDSGWYDTEFVENRFYRKQVEE